MVFTERAPRQLQFHVAADMSATKRRCGYSKRAVQIDIYTFRVTNDYSAIMDLLGSREWCSICHCEALRAHLEVSHSTSVQINK